MTRSYSALFDVTCSGCGTETAVGEFVMPATRYAPAEGERSPEECPKCGKPFDNDDDWQEAEPPEVERDDGGRW